MNKATDFNKDNYNSLKTHRQMNNLSQEQLAEQSGISIRTIQRIEKGVATGSAYTLKALADVLHTNTMNLKTQEIVYTLPQYDNKSQLKWLNLSVLSVMVLPLSNVILPVLLFWSQDYQFSNFVDISYTISHANHSGYPFTFISTFTWKQHSTFCSGLCCFCNFQRLLHHSFCYQYNQSI